MDYTVVKCLEEKLIANSFYPIFLPNMFLCFDKELADRITKESIAAMDNLAGRKECKIHGKDGE